MHFYNNNPLLGCLGSLCGPASYVKTLAPTEAAYYPVEKSMLAGPASYVKTLAPTEAAYYPVQKSILKGLPPFEESIMDSPVAKVLLGAAIFTGGYLLAKAMYEPAPITLRVMNRRKNKQTRK